MPSMSDGTSPEAIAKFDREIEAGCRAQGRFANELLAGYPRHPELPEMLSTRWAGMNNALGEAEAVLRETASMVERKPSDALARAAWPAMARAANIISDLTLAERREIVLRAAREAAGEENAGYQLLEFARLHVTDPAEAREIADRVAKEYAKTEWTAPDAKSWRKQLDRIGTAHRESFADFRDGAPFDSDAVKGPRIVHYWGPTANGVEEELREIARLRERHGAQAFAVCGVHDGRSWLGDDGLARWLAERKVDWPMRLALAPEGKAPWDTGVSVPQIPFALLIDREGRIQMISARVAALAPMLEKLLAEGGKKRETL
jgi:hypothetical protein